MASVKRRCCKPVKQCRILVLYVTVSVVIIFWIYAMNYGTVVDDKGYASSKTETASGGFKSKIGNVRTHAYSNLSRSQSADWYQRKHHDGGTESTDFTFWEKPDQDLGRLTDEQSFCNGRFLGYSRTFAKLSQVVIDPRFGQGRQGGENISDVINQAEDAEYYKLKNGYFRLVCKANVQYSFLGPGHLNDWMNALRITDDSPNMSSARQTNWVVAVLRYEYANLYHTMTDFYNAFLLAKIFKMDVNNVTILWIDGHPVGALDNTWKVLFGNVSRASDIHAPVIFDKFVWNIVGYKSPLNDHALPRVPCLEEFREFFLKRHGIPTNHQLNCNNLNVLLLWRRDYIAHPRNPSGHVARKIKNEEELENAIKARMPGHSVQGIQLDALPMQQQLEIISTTDILIGMHGAGLAHTLFLPKHGGLIELYPTYWPAANRHFRAMAQWRYLQYSNWINSDRSRELPNHFTVVDVKAVQNMAHEMHHKICDDKVH